MCHDRFHVPNPALLVFSENCYNAEDVATFGTHKFSKQGEWVAVYYSSASGLECYIGHFHTVNVNSFKYYFQLHSILRQLTFKWIYNIFVITSL